MKAHLLLLLAAALLSGCAAAAPRASASTSAPGIASARTLLLALQQAAPTPAAAAVAAQQGSVAGTARALAARLESAANAPAVAAATSGPVSVPPALVTDLARLLTSSNAQPALDQLFAAGGRLAKLAPPYDRSARCAEVGQLQGVSQQTKACYCDTTNRQPWPRCDALLHLDLIAAGAQLDKVAQEFQADLGSWEGAQAPAGQAPATRRLMGRQGTPWQPPKRCDGLSPAKCQGTKPGGSGPLLGGGGRCASVNALDAITNAVQTGCGSFACNLNLEPIPLQLKLNLTGCIPTLKLRDDNGDGVVGDGDTVAMCRQGRCSSVPFATAAQWATVASHFDTGVSGGVSACLGFPSLSELLQKWGWLNAGGNWCLSGAASLNWYPLKRQASDGKVNYADGTNNPACSAFAAVDPKWKCQDFCSWAAGKGRLVARLGWSILGFNNVLTAQLMNTPTNC